MLPPNDVTVFYWRLDMVPRFLLNMLFHIANSYRSDSLHSVTKEMVICILCAKLAVGTREVAGGKESNRWLASHSFLFAMRMLREKVAGTLMSL